MEHITHVTCYIKFKLLYHSKIVAFFFLSKYKYNALSPILLKLVF